MIGNVTVGGTGKTPFTIWLATQLQAQGVRVGIVLRGYGGNSVALAARREPRFGAGGSRRRSGAAGDSHRRNRRRRSGPGGGGRRAIERGAEIVLSDDGLQHYRLARDREIVVIDGRRGVGNRRLLPAGPLREPVSRLAQADLRVVVVARRRRRGR